jgi:hypothetical protein
VKHTQELAPGFLIQLPIAILVIKGFSLKSVIGDRKQSFVYDHSMENGKYLLYDYTTAEEVGFITVKNQLDNGLIISIESKSASGRDDVFNKVYNFINLKIIDFYLERKEYKREIYWMGQHDGINLIIVCIFNDHASIPASIYSEKRKYFFYSAVEKDYYDYITREKSPLPINKIVYNNAIKSISSGIFCGEFTNP